MSLVPSVYGTIDSIKLLEEIAIWKEQERERAVAIRSAAPGLEEAYAEWLGQWEQVFGQSRDIAAKLKEELSEDRDSEETPEDAGKRSAFCSRLLEDALGQSREFARQLLLLRQQSSALTRLESSHSLFALLDRQWRSGSETLSRLREAGALRPNVRSDSEDEPMDGSGGPEPADGASADLLPRRDPGRSGAELAEERPEPTWSAPLEAAEASAESPVPIGGHRLPPLPYSYKALEPYIDEKTMRIHHDKHHLSYVEGLNKAEKKLEEARHSGNFDLVKHWERELAFNGAGHYLHTIFWDAMTPKGGGKPSGALLDAINRSFGSYGAFHKQFSEAASKVEGGGWAILVWSPRSHRLEILTAEKHQNLSQWDVVPLLPLDVWEHAYYLKHQNDRAAYVKDWWNVVNWPYVAERFAKARKLKWVPE